MLCELEMSCYILDESYDLYSMMADVDHGTASILQYTHIKACNLVLDLH